MSDAGFYLTLGLLLLGFIAGALVDLVMTVRAWRRRR
jgi:hypothetical protein